jgi:hypothetical protein
MKKIYIFAAALILIVGGYYIYQIGPEQSDIEPESQLVETPETQTSSDKPNDTNLINLVSGFENIILVESNWEAVGSIINISKNGEYSVESGRPGIINKKEGKLTVQQLKELNALLNDADVFLLQDEYTGQRKTTRSWINYRLTVESISETKSISFHSEDETLPQSLYNLVNKTEQFANEQANNLPISESICVEDFTSCCVGDNCVSNEIECAEGYVSKFNGCDLEKCFPKWDCVEFDGNSY